MVVSSDPALVLEDMTYDLESVCDYADGHQLLAVVSSVHHKRVGEALNDRALCLSESLCGISTCGVGDVDWSSDLDVITLIFVSGAVPACWSCSSRQTDIANFYIFIRPSVEESD